MFPILVILFIVVPVIEIALFIQVGGLIGLWPTIAIVLITAFVGASLVRSQGIQTLMSVQSRLQQGELPAQQIIEGVMLAVAGVLLLTPGFMTDALGMLVLLPAPRAVIAKQLMKRVKVNTSVNFGGGFHQDPFGASEHDQQGDVFEGEYEKKTDEDKRIDK
ncbi:MULTISPECIES: FxsA family protein [Vibrio]|uniref:Membrane protein FxsA n=1 Tax=Vibrio casei TaxID=673372 RepID=A0A368LGM0_9VIBR|nr:MULTISPECIES: FxsA family protein [Vibrio]RCS69228.1 membrane protein FxsA [Vibrio casei]SJN37983.1 FxsA protein [Vibrio casei]HBV76243.1 membrane protein FxsA [Vibrio sp.]